MSNKDTSIRLQSSDELKKPVKQRDPKKGRMLLYALGGIVVLAALVIGVKYAAEAIVEYVELNRDHTIKLTEYSVDQVRKIEIDGKTDVTISRLGITGGYAIRELPEAVTSQTACENAFANAASLLSEGIAAENVTDFTDFGLNNPLSTVRITYSDRELLLEIGDIAPSSQHHYVRVDGGDTVYLMRQMIVKMFSDGVAAYRDISGFGVSAENLTGFALETEGKLLSLAHYDKIGGSVFTLWQMTEPWVANTDGAKADALVAGVADIALESFVKTAREGQLADYGLDAPRQTLTLTYGDGSTFTMALGDQNNVGNYYAAFDGTSDVYLVRKESVEFMQGVKAEQYVNEFANIVAINSVDALDVTLDGTTLHFTIDRSGEDPVFTLDGTPVEAEGFKNAFQNLNIVPVNGFGGVTDIAAPALELTYTFNNGEEPYHVVYLDDSINNYTLSKNGEISVTVSKDDMAPVLEMWRAYLK